MKVREAPQDKERTELTREIPWVAVGVPVLNIITTCRGLGPEMKIDDQLFFVFTTPIQSQYLFHHYILRTNTPMQCINQSTILEDK